MNGKISQREQFQHALKAKSSRVHSAKLSYNAKGRGPNKAAGSKGGIRRQGSKR